MSSENDQTKYHRTGEPGGPGCTVGVLSIQSQRPDGSHFDGVLLDAGKKSTETELLRTVAEKLGVVWGEDELGWWAAVQFPEFPSWSVRRLDDNDNEFVVQSNLTETQANSLAKEYEEKGHKQSYWARNDVNQ